MRQVLLFFSALFLLSLIWSKLLHSFPHTFFITAHLFLLHPNSFCFMICFQRKCYESGSRWRISSRKLVGWLLRPRFFSKPRRQTVLKLLAFHSGPLMKVKAVRWKCRRKAFMDVCAHKFSFCWIMYILPNTPAEACTCLTLLDCKHVAEVLLVRWQM